MLVLLLCLGLAGCATNPYQKFYHDATGGADVTKLKQFETPPDVPKLYTGNNVQEDAQRMAEDGYTLLGYSSFNGATINQNVVIDEGKKVHSAVILVYSKYTNTLSGQMPLLVPDNKVITTNSSGTANYTGNGSFSGINYGTGNRYSGTSNMYGTANAYGHATTTVYGTQTMYVPYNINRYDYLASFWIKNKQPVLGIMIRDLTSDERAKIGTNKGIFAYAIIKNSPAYKADLFKGDIVIKINNDDIFSSNNFLILLNTKYVGKKVTLTIIRDGKTLTKEVQLTEGNMVQDEKYGRIPERFYVYRSQNTKFHKTAKVNYNKLVDNYKKSKENGIVMEQLATLDIPVTIQNEIVKNIRTTIDEYGTKNQYRAIFKDDMPNCNETEDVTDALLSILNNKS